MSVDVETIVDDIEKKKSKKLKKAYKVDVWLIQKKNLWRYSKNIVLSLVIFSLEDSEVVFPINMNCSKLCNLEIFVKFVWIGILRPWVIFKSKLINFTNMKPLA